VADASGIGFSVVVPRGDKDPKRMCLLEGGSEELSAVFGKDGLVG